MKPTRAWALLGCVVAGYALGVALASQLDVALFDLLLPIVGAAAGYAAVRFVVGAGPSGRRGQLKYWRGRAFYDDE